MNNFLGEIKGAAKRIGKKIAKKVLHFFLPLILVILFVLILISGLVYLITIQDGSYREGDWSSVPYAVSQYTSEIEIDENGNIKTSMTAQELWDKMIENDSRIEEYLSGPEELLKLMNAEITTNYPDTRPNPDEPIDWNNLNKDVNSNLSQGIIKFKRAKSDGTIQTMTYVNQDTFYNWIEEYNETGNESVREQLITHFTIEKNGSLPTGSNDSLNYNTNDIITDISERIVAAAKITPSPGAGLCQAWVRQVYANAGLGNVYFDTAADAYRANLVSTDMNNIPIGAAVYGTGSGNSSAGHVGIYIGNGMVMDNVGSIQTSTLEEWVGWQEERGYEIDGKVGWLGWGWQAGSPSQILSNGNSSSNDNSDLEGEKEHESESSSTSNIQMKLIEQNGKITFYNGDGSAMEGGSNNALGYALEEGQAAVSLNNFGKYKNSVIYIETTSSGEGSAANGKFVYVTDNGGGVRNNQIDVYANVDQTTMNKEPYGTFNSGAKFYLVEENVTYDDYKSKYLNQTGGGQTGNLSGNATKTKYNVVVATWNETQEIVESNDPQVTEKNNTVTTAKTQKINYQDMVSNYKMPFNYLWAFIVAGRDKKFSLSLADLVYGSQIEFTVFDNLTVTTNVERHDYIREKTQVVQGETVTVQENYYTTYTTISKINTLNVCITRANVWIVDYSQNFTYEVPEDIVSPEQTVDDGNGGTITTSNNVHKNTYISSPPNLIEKVDPKSNEDNFVTLFLKSENYELRKNILSAPDWLYEILKNNPDTANMIDLTKYLFYKATGTDYGVTDFDFSIYEPGNFTTVSGIYGNTTQEKVWFALKNAGYSEIAVAAVMGNIQYESGFNSSLEEAGNGIGFGLCQWSFGRRDALEAYATSKGVDVSDIQTQIEFLIAELTPGGGANGYASYQMGGTSSSKYDGNRYTVSDWKNATDVKTATIAFMAIFERPSYDPSVNHMSGRIDAAQKFYNEFQGKTAPTSDDRIGKITLAEPNATKMASMLSEAIRIAEDDRYTYSQANRYGEFQYDCSSFVARLYEEFFGIKVPTTTSQYSTSNSAYVGREGSVTLQPGDVLWREEHVEIYLGNGLKVGARSSRVSPQDQIKIDNYSAGQFTYVYRFIK